MTRAMLAHESQLRAVFAHCVEKPVHIWYNVPVICTLIWRNVGRRQEIE